MSTALIQKLRYMARQYTSGQFARGGNPPSKHYLDEAADLLEQYHREASAQQLKGLTLSNRECVGESFEYDGGEVGISDSTLKRCHFEFVGAAANTVRFLREIRAVSPETFETAFPSSQPSPSAEPVAMSRHSFAMLCNVLWHHQGGSSPVGQPIRGIIGIGQHDRMTDEQLDEAKWIDRLLATADQAAPQPDSGRVDASVELDARRYARLRVLGAAPGQSKQLAAGTVLRFQSLDAYVDADLKAYSSRGEVKRSNADSGRVAELEAEVERMRELLGEVLKSDKTTLAIGTRMRIRAALAAKGE